jgi:hypothetical protein
VGCAATIAERSRTEDSYDFQLGILKIGDAAIESCISESLTRLQRKIASKEKESFVKARQWRECLAPEKVRNSSQIRKMFMVNKEWP